MVDTRSLRTHPEFQSLHSFPVFKTLGEKPKSRLEKFLSVFADVRAGEGVSALLLALNLFLLLAAYYLLKPVRDTLILSETGAEEKSYWAAGQALLLLGVVPLYGWIATKVNRIRLLSGATLFFVTCLVLFWLGGLRGLREGVVFYIWLGIYNVFTVSQLWAFANDIYTEGQGRRLFPLIGIGMSVGALVGSAVAAPLVSAGLRTYSFMLVAAVVLLACLGLTLIVNARERRAGPAEMVKEGEQPLGSEGGFELIVRDRYLFWIAILIVLLNLVNTTGQYTLDKFVEMEASAAGGDVSRFMNGFYAQFYAAQNLLGLLLQALAASRIIRHFGVRGALFVLPVVSLISYSVLAVAPLLMVVRWTKVLENSTDYSIMNTVRQALWLPTTREAKYKAKAAIDTFCVRGGDVLQAGVVYVGKTLGAGVSGFAWFNVALTVAWLGAAGRVFAEHRKRTI